MTIQHSQLPNAELHEPKGVANASAGEVYIADGLGSGEWKIQPSQAFGSMEITNNATSFSVSAASDATLHTDNDFVKISTGWTVGNALKNMAFTTDHLTVELPGIYEVISYLTISSDTSNIQVGMKYVINDTDFVTRTPQTYFGTAGNIYNLAGHGFADALNANDEIYLYIAADKSANITINDAKVTMLLLGG